MSDHVKAAHFAIEAAVQQHGEGFLQFSGGLSSLACLYLARPWWPQLLVLWGNAGDEYPETRTQMAEVEAMVPFFREIRGKAQTEQHLIGFPVDMLPGRATWAGRYMNPDEHHRPMRLADECCASNWCVPTGEFVKHSGLKLVIRGQRTESATRASGVTHGTVLEEITYALPIEDWSAQQVKDYLASQGVPLLPQSAYGAGSLGCMHCTAYLKNAGPRLRYLGNHHPAAKVEVIRRLKIIEKAQECEAHLMRDVLQEAGGSLDA